MEADFTREFFYEFVTLFVILNPATSIPMFLTATAGLDRRGSIQVGALALGISFAILTFFIVAGQSLLVALKIPLESFQLAGSLILLLFSIQMVLGRLGSDEPAAQGSSGLMQRAIFPLAIPGIAGAGSMLAVVMLTDNATRSVAEQVKTTGVLGLCLAIFFVLFVLAGPIFRILGRPGIEIITRVFGLILASIAVTGLIIAIKASFKLA